MFKPCDETSVTRPLVMSQFRILEEFLWMPLVDPDLVGRRGASLGVVIK